MVKTFVKLEDSNLKKKQYTCKSNDIGSTL